MGDPITSPPATMLTLQLVQELFDIEQQAQSARLTDEHGRPMGTLGKRYWNVRAELSNRIKLVDAEPEVDIRRLVREYVAQEIKHELQGDNGSKFVVRVLGEVLANKPNYAERVYVEATELMRELLKNA